MRWSRGSTGRKKTDSKIYDKSKIIPENNRGEGSVIL